MKRVGIIRRDAAGASRRVIDEVAWEEPLELRVDTRPIAVIMRTPGHDAELDAGFLLAEGLIRRRGEVREIRPDSRNRADNVINVLLAPEVRLDYAQLSRHVFASSSCGLCGKSSIASVRRQFPRLQGRFQISPERLLALPAAMRAAQTTFATTGGLHAAALFTPAGEILSLREDIGRHNAVDKLLGRALLDDKLPLGGCGLLVSGRASFEILQKALAGGLSMIAAVSAPSSLAIEFARRNQQTLIGFLREGRFNIYSRPDRLKEG